MPTLVLSIAGAVVACVVSATGTADLWPHLLIAALYMGAMVAATRPLWPSYRRAEQIRSNRLPMNDTGPNHAEEDPELARLDAAMASLQLTIERNDRLARGTYTPADLLILRGRMDP
ncbi:hypothetical protein DVB87_09990 [Tsukamurella tyrosinosolvens]|nr:hypothetical protein DVB87_09990 [Tsukamurella tyrosinosolvens]